MNLHMDSKRLCVLKVIVVLFLSAAGCTSKDTLDMLEVRYKDAIISCERLHPSGIGPQAELWTDPAYDFDPRPKERCETFYRPK